MKEYKNIILKPDEYRKMKSAKKQNKKSKLRHKKTNQS